MKKIRMSNAEGRDATVSFTTVKGIKRPPLGLTGSEVSFRRYLAATDDRTHDALAGQHADLAQALVDGDPEVDIEVVGRRLGTTDIVYLSGSGDVLYAAPQVLEVLIGPDGEEKERRVPVDNPGNVNADDAPLRWTRRRMKRADVVRRFVFPRTVQVHHVDGLTYDYLHAMAKELDDADEMVLLGAGEKGRDPVRFNMNGTPYRAFLEGRVDGARYMLLLHLSNMELKMPGGAA
jgi:hypothetical protein